MMCADCGKTGEKLFEYVDGRRTIRLCEMCKAEREWRSLPDTKPVPLPEKRKSLWERLLRLFGIR